MFRQIYFETICLSNVLYYAKFWPEEKTYKINEPNLNQND